MQSLTDLRPAASRSRSGRLLLLVSSLLTTSALVLACGSGAEPTPQTQPQATGGETAPEAPPAEDAEAQEAACLSLAQTPCTKSPDCTLVQDESAESGYRCRAAQGPCEEGFRQQGSTQEDCESREGCRFEPARCYCPPEVTCVCGGGPPARCVEAGAPSTSPQS
ncbi:MAG: hypothetical protein SX243_13425 [Acidobacteriota bacterium]|nr:hypothetical protein [Acidobacteriota bacterium]